MLVFHALAPDVSLTETNRIVSPSGKIDAVVIEADGGATTSVIQRIYLVEHGEQASGFPDAILDGATVYNDENSSVCFDYGVKMKWEPSSKLILKYVSVNRSEVFNSPIKIAGENIYINLHPETH